MWITWTNDLKKCKVILFSKSGGTSCSLRVGFRVNYIFFVGLPGGAGSHAAIHLALKGRRGGLSFAIMISLFLYTNKYAMFCVGKVICILI